MKVALYHNIIAPYRIPLFEELSKRIDLTVYFGKATNKNRKWRVQEPPFKHEVLKEQFLPFKLLRERYEAYIGADSKLLGTHITFIIAKLLRKPFILWIGERDYSTESPKSLYFKILEAISYIIAKKADACIAYGLETAYKLSRFGVNPNKIHLGTNTISLEPLRTEYLNADSDSLREKLGIKNDSKIILSLSYLEKRKGIQHLLVAFNKLRKEHENLVLIIAGSGPYQKTLKEIAEPIGNVIFPGHVYEDKATYYKMASVFVLPSLRDPWGLTVNEAMICEKPVITTYDAGAYELIKGNGIVIPSGNSYALYIALKYVLSESEEMGHRSWEIMRENTIQKTASIFMEAIKSVY